jgi:sphinganine-1-phosphate aldolase
MFRTKQLRRAAYFIKVDWPGGLYATATLLGSRTAAPIAGTWFAMMYHGKKKYIHNAQIITSAVKKFVEAIKKEDQL